MHNLKSNILRRSAFYTAYATQHIKGMRCVVWPSLSFPEWIRHHGQKLRTR